ncbi:MAG: hypothetical protein L6R43_12195 [Planctomycetes bacterium]|nr:hypothetical protein [Planctomycetota bacterium]
MGGLVLVGDGTPAPGAVVTLAAEGSPEAGTRGTTDGDGAFAMDFPVPPAGAWVRAEASTPDGTSAAWPLRLHLDPAQPVRFLVLRMGGTALLRGRAVRGDGSPAAGAEVLLLLWPSTPPPAWAAGTLDTRARPLLAGPDGRFESRVEQGRLRAFVRAPGATFGRPVDADATGAGEIDLGDVASGDEGVEVILDIRTGDGSPAAGAVARLEAPEAAEALFLGGAGRGPVHFRSGADGVLRFRVRTDPAPLLLGVGADSCGPVDVRIERSVPGPRRGTVHLPALHSRILRVVDESGRPLPEGIQPAVAMGALSSGDAASRIPTVLLGAAPGPARLSDGRLPAEVLLDEAGTVPGVEEAGGGEFLLRSAVPGTREVRLDVPFASREALAVEFSPEVEGTPFEVRLPEGRVLALRVTDGGIEEGESAADLRARRSPWRVLPSAGEWPATAPGRRRASAGGASLWGDEEGATRTLLLWLPLECTHLLIGASGGGGAFAGDHGVEDPEAAGDPLPAPSGGEFSILAVPPGGEPEMAWTMPSPIRPLPRFEVAVQVRFAGRALRVPGIAVVARRATEDPRDGAARSHGASTDGEGVARFSLPAGPWEILASGTQVASTILELDPGAVPAGTVGVLDLFPPRGSGEDGRR